MVFANLKTQRDSHNSERRKKYAKFIRTTEYLNKKNNWRTQEVLTAHPPTCKGNKHEVDA